MPTKWIDFAALKRQVKIRDVLARYGHLDALEEKKPGRLVGPCPIHGGRGKTSFNVDTAKNVYNCFSKCGGGNVLDLVMLLEECEIREAALKLSQWFSIEHTRVRGASDGGGNSANVSQKTTLRNAIATHTQPAVNPPLERSLKRLNADHPYLVERGLTLPTIRYFGIGHCTRGIMQGRIAIPIHNEAGELVAYAGRAVADELAEEKGKYRLPDGFKKSHVVYNLNRAQEHADNGLVVVEGFFGAFALHQAGFPNVVALMGSTLSDEQAELLATHTNRLSLMLDGDDAGYECVRAFYGKLRRRLYLKEIHLEDGEQPDSLDVERLKALLT